ncbi:hypothetical protein SBOR_0474 [Sclerotinia borealis F-4128]|uniref:Uncharacterized protein n=1 Tax=Sclerotinia borealis (strain F-4128) TaxID=1432307 RepID=W9CSP5_SCLBF|nr:hypothetical protein SBOR_0474 [Sclerotinia borealis F-4128]
MPPNSTRSTAIEDLLDYIREDFPNFDATLEILQVILESDPSTSAVAKSYRRWLYISVMQQVLTLGEKEKEEWVVDLFSGNRNIVESFADTMCEDGFWTEEEDEEGIPFYAMDRQREANLYTWLARPDIQSFYQVEVLKFCPLIMKDSIEGSDHIPEKGPKSAYKVVVPDWQKEIIATKRQLAQSQSLVEDLKEQLAQSQSLVEDLQEQLVQSQSLVEDSHEQVHRANEIIATQAKAIDSKNEQLKVARTTKARWEKAWMKRYKKFFKRTWK